MALHFGVDTSAAAAVKWGTSARPDPLYLSSYLSPYLSSYLSSYLLAYLSAYHSAYLSAYLSASP